MPAMVVTRLDDRNDDLLADYRSVPDPALAARRGLFVAEGRLVVRRLLTASPMRTRSVMLTDTALRSLQDVVDRRPDLPVYVVPQAVMDGIAGFNIHRGCLALGERPPAIDWRTLPGFGAAAAAADAAAGAERAGGTGARAATRRDRPLAVVMERVGNADNVGAIFRNAAAFGADAVLLGPACADPLYRKAIRTSMGAALSMPSADVEPWPAALCELRERAFAVIALTPASTAMPLHEAAAAARNRPVALVLGHEGAGLSPEALDACDLHARIPMAEGADSLNVAAAAAVALYELARR